MQNPQSLPWGSYTDKKNQKLTAKGQIDKRYKKDKTCSLCGTQLTLNNWPINARKYKGKIWHVCESCYKTTAANATYKTLRGLKLIKRPKPIECEICCKVSKILCWHHWDNEDTSKGVWVCRKCHWIIEIHEKNPQLIVKYSIIKKILENPLNTEVMG
jgi:ribosomal protein L37AE/L43A